MEGEREFGFIIIDIFHDPFLFAAQSPSRTAHPPKFFSEPSEEDKAAADAKRLAYKEQCEREVEEFQKSLALEEAVSE